MLALSSRVDCSRGYALCSHVVGVCVSVGLQKGGKEKPSAGNVMADPRFSALFTNPDFQIDPDVRVSAHFSCHARDA